MATKGAIIFMDAKVQTDQQAQGKANATTDQQAQGKTST